MRQLIDLIDRVAEVAAERDTRRAAAGAHTALDRGVVAAATRVSDGRVGGPVAAAPGDGFVSLPVVTRTRRLS